MRILQLNTFDHGGGAEAVALGLHRTYQVLGHQAWLAVRRRKLDEPGVFEIPQTLGLNRVSATLVNLANRLNPYSGFAAAAFKSLARPQAALERFLGHEDFHFPSSAHLPDLLTPAPDILQTHNLHGNYFGLEALPTLSHRFPLVLTLHDAWMTSGHCAHSFACDRWQSGCGLCPDLTTYPSVRRDATAFNWSRKKRIFSQCRLRVATPSAWLMRRIERSILAPSIVEARVIPNSVDDAFFQPPDRAEARRRLSIPDQAVVLLFAANTIRANEWKDFTTLREALKQISQALPYLDVVFLALGEDAPEEQVGRARLIFLPFRNCPAEVAICYQAADIYLHAAKAETFSLTIAEAQAAGTPVVATDVGAISERILCASCHPRDRATGFLVPPGRSDEMAKAVLRLLNDAELAANLSCNARRHAEETYRRLRQAKSYADWFSRLLGSAS